MPAVSRAWLREVGRPTSRLTRRAADWTALTTRLAARAARGAARGTWAAARRGARALAVARVAGADRLSQATRTLRGSSFCSRTEPRASTSLEARRGFPSDLAMLFLGSAITGAVYGLSASWSQTLTTAVCALTAAFALAAREGQRRDAADLRRSVDALRESLRVTHALLDASELQDAEELRASLVPSAPAVEATAGEGSSRRLNCPHEPRA